MNKIITYYRQIEYIVSTKVDDLLKIIECTEKAINKNHYIEEMWKQIGYVDVNENKKSK